MTRYTCHLCGRKTDPFAFVNGRAVGPTCAKKAGISASVASVSSSGTAKKKTQKTSDADTIDLFSDYNLITPE